MGVNDPFAPVLTMSFIFCIIRAISWNHGFWSPMTENRLDLYTTQGFLIQDLFHSTPHQMRLTTWGSSGASKGAKFFKELTFSSFMRYFSAKIEQSSKMSKIELTNAHFGWFLKVCSILAEK